MLYAGVEFERYGFNVTLLSETFAWLGENRFYNSKPPSVLEWIEQFKAKADEPLRWYFDESDWLNPDLPTHFFDFEDELNKIYLIKHRTVCNLVQFLIEWSVSQFKLTTTMKRSLILASASRFLGPNQIKRLANNRQLTFYFR